MKFEVGKRYKFDKGTFSNLRMSKDQRETQSFRDPNWWFNRLDGKEVKPISEYEGKIGDHLISVDWCKEI